MKKNKIFQMKKYMLIALVGICMTSLVTGCGKSNKSGSSEQPKANTNENVVKDQTLDVFHFTNTSLIYENGTTTLETTVTNTSDETAYLVEFKIHVKDTEGNDIIELVGFVGDQLKANESRVITSSASQDLMLADSIEYEVVR